MVVAQSVGWTFKSKSNFVLTEHTKSPGSITPLVSDPAINWGGNTTRGGNTKVNTPDLTIESFFPLSRRI